MVERGSVAEMGSDGGFGAVRGQIIGCDVVITFRKIIRSLTAAMPGWLIVICGVCLAVPLVRLAALLFTVAFCLIQPVRVRRAASAWKGGKSHRASDESARARGLQPGLTTGGTVQRCARELHPHAVMRPERSTENLEIGRRDVRGHAEGLRPGVRAVRHCQMTEGLVMAIGPVQLIVLGFNHPDFHGEIIAELERLRESDTIRVIDSLAVYKDADGELEVEHLSNLTQQEAIELGSKIGALIGLGIEGEEGAEAGAAAGAEQAAAEGINVFGDAGEWDVLEDIPNDSAAALILIEHHWAVPLRDAIARAGGFRLSDGFISPLDLVEIGLMSADEAKDLHAMETSGAAS